MTGSRNIIILSKIGRWLFNSKTQSSFYKIAMVKVTISSLARSELGKARHQLLKLCGLQRRMKNWEDSSTSTVTSRGIVSANSCPTRPRYGASSDGCILRRLTKPCPCPKDGTKGWRQSSNKAKARCKLGSTLLRLTLALSLWPLSRWAAAPSGARRRTRLSERRSSNMVPKTGSS